MTEPPSSKSTPPIGVAPEGREFVHPWIISTIASAIFFALGFAVMYATGLWANFWQWADGPFLFYFAILLPVLGGFYAYGMYLLLSRLLGRARKKSE